MKGKQSDTRNDATAQQCFSPRDYLSTMKRHSNRVLNLQQTSVHFCVHENRVLKREIQELRQEASTSKQEHLKVLKALEIERLEKERLLEELGRVHKIVEIKYSQTTHQHYDESGEEISDSESVPDDESASEASGAKLSRNVDANGNWNGCGMPPREHFLAFAMIVHPRLGAHSQFAAGLLGDVLWHIKVVLYEEESSRVNIHDRCPGFAAATAARLQGRASRAFVPNDHHDQVMELSDTEDRYDLPASLYEMPVPHTSSHTH